MTPCDPGVSVAPSVGMATSPLPAYRAAEAKMPLQVGGITSVPRIEPMILDGDCYAGCDAARGILFGLLLCVPFWVGIYSMLF